MYCLPAHFLTPAGMRCHDVRLVGEVRPCVFTHVNNSNNNDFFCANILEDQAQWRNKTKGLRKRVIVTQCECCFFLEHLTYFFEYGSERCVTVRICTFNKLLYLFVTNKWWFNAERTKQVEQDTKTKYCYYCCSCNIK